MSDMVMRDIEFGNAQEWFLSRINSDNKKSLDDRIKTIFALTNASQISPALKTKFSIHMMDFRSAMIIFIETSELIDDMEEQEDGACAHAYINKLLAQTLVVSAIERMEDVLNITPPAPQPPESVMKGTH